MIDTRQAVSYMLREIRHICQNLPKRAPGSEGERMAAEYMADTLRKECGCSKVVTETFEEHPAAFYGYFYFSAVFDVISWAGFFLSPWISIVSGMIAMLLFIFQFICYKQIIDPLFRKRTSVNVTAVRPCTRELKQRVFLNGHTDAAWEFPLNYYCGGVVFEIPGAMALIGVLLNISLAIFALTGSSWARSVFPYMFVFVPFFVLVARTYDPKRIVDGANDNLSGCYMGIALLREMERQKIELEHTELGVILTGSEEAGLRGAKAWTKQHREDYQDVPTYVISYDTIFDPNQLMVNYRDLNGTVKADQAFADRFMEAAAEAGVPCKKGWVPPFGGATDSAAFTQGGFRSIGVTGLNHKLEDYYHTRRDTWDHMNPEGLENCLKATIRLLEKME